MSTTYNSLEHTINVTLERSIKIFESANNTTLFFEPLSRKFEVVSADGESLCNTKSKAKAINVFLKNQ